MNSDAPLPSSFDSDPEFFIENRWQMLWRRLREEPLLPLGCALTTWALIGAGRSIRQGDKHKTNRMFRRRIYAQGFTIAAMLAGSFYWREDRDKRKEFNKVVEERKARERRDAWIRELEFRDREDRARLDERQRRKEEAALLKARMKAGEGLETAQQGMVQAAERGADKVREAKETVVAVANADSETKESGSGVVDSVKRLWDEKK